MNPVFVALTAEGLTTARRAKAAIGGELHALAGVKADADVLTVSDTGAHLRALFDDGRPIVGVCAAGILIRILAPLIANKRAEPPVLALSEDGGAIVPLLGGHRGGNDLARALADALGGHAAITMAGDNRFGVALDAPPPGWTLASPQDAKAAMAALLAGARARLDGDAPWLAESRLPFAADGTVRLVATTQAVKGDADGTRLTSPLRGGRNRHQPVSGGGGILSRSTEGERGHAAVTPSRNLPSQGSANVDLPSRGRLSSARS